MQAGTVGPLALSRLEVSPHTVRRTTSLAAGTKGDQYKLSLMLGGQALVVQDGREAVLRRGDFALYDCSRPYTIVGGEDFRMLVCMLPRDVLGLFPERVARMTATRIAGDNGIAWALAPFLERLADLVIRGELAEAHDRVVESVVDLVESLCVQRSVTSRVPPGTRVPRCSFARRAYAEAQPRRPAALPGGHRRCRRTCRSATCTGCSRQRACTVSAWIRRRRLEGCRRDLADPARRGETVTSIGARWGLTNPAHLSRLFRDAYAVSPTEYRAERLRVTTQALTVLR